jgi:GTP pyrophosphokinase
MRNHKWSKLAEAFDFAASEHQYQYRKSTDIPYISHLMSVSALVMEHGGSEDQAIAGLLHDVVEDAKPSSRIPEIKKEILNRFGAKVLELVEGCTDGEPDADGKKADWKSRKELYLAKLETKSEDLLLVSCCDKLHNARSILTDLVTHGRSMFDRFSATQDETLWYYRSLSELFSRRLKGLRAEVAARELAFTLSEIEMLVLDSKVC